MMPQIRPCALVLVLLFIARPATAEDAEESGALRSFKVTFPSAHRERVLRIAGNEGLTVFDPSSGKPVAATAALPPVAQPLSMIQDSASFLDHLRELPVRLVRVGLRPGSGSYSFEVTDLRIAGDETGLKTLSARVGELAGATLSNYWRLEVIPSSLSPHIAIERRTFGIYHRTVEGRIGEARPGRADLKMDLSAQARAEGLQARFKGPEKVTYDAEGGFRAVSRELEVRTSPLSAPKLWSFLAQLERESHTTVVELEYKRPKGEDDVGVATVHVASRVPWVSTETLLMEIDARALPADAPQDQLVVRVPLRRLPRVFKLARLLAGGQVALTHEGGQTVKPWSPRLVERVVDASKVLGAIVPALRSANMRFASFEITRHVVRVAIEHEVPEAEVSTIKTTKALEQRILSLLKESWGGALERAGLPSGFDPFARGKLVIDGWRVGRRGSTREPGEAWLATATIIQELKLRGRPRADIELAPASRLPSLRATCDSIESVGLGIYSASSSHATSAATGVGTRTLRINGVAGTIRSAGDFAGMIVRLGDLGWTVTSTSFSGALYRDSFSIELAFRYAMFDQP
jgi:hypothetical protein